MERAVLTENVMLHINRTRFRSRSSDSDSQPLLFPSKTGGLNSISTSVSRVRNKAS